MSRYCSVSLVDIGVSNKIKRNTKSEGKLNLGYKTMSTKLNKFVQKEIKTDIVTVSSKNKIGKAKPSDVREVSNTIVERATRSSKRIPQNMSLSQNSPKKTVKTNLDMDCEQTEVFKNVENSIRKGNIVQLPNKIKTKTQKRRASSGENPPDAVSLNKKPCNVKNGMSTTSNQAGNSNNEICEEKQTKMRKRKRFTTFWESKLTGARRVSKRLKYLKIKNRVLGKLDININTHHKVIKNKKRNTIKSISEKKTKTIKITHNRYSKIKEPKVKKSVLNRNCSELQTIYGKLNHTKKLYPRIASNKKILTSYRVKRKPAVLHNLSDLNKPVNVFHEDRGSTNEPSNEVTYTLKEEVTNPTACLTSATVTEDVGSTEVVKNEQELVSGHKVNNDLGNKNSVDLNFEDKTLNFSEIANEKTEKSILSDNVQEECVDSPGVIILDLESGETVLCEHSEEYVIPIPNVAPEKCTKTNKEKEPIVEHSNLINLVTVRSDNEAISKAEKSGGSFLEIQNKSKTNDKAISSVTDETTAKSDEILIHENTGVNEEQISNKEVLDDKSSILEEVTVE